MLLKDKQSSRKFKEKMKPTKAKTKSQKRMSFCLHRWVEFFKSTDFHGYKYIVMPKLTLLERFSWVLAVLICMVSAICLLHTAWNWYTKNPTVTVIESTHSPIWDIPFPAVTVCDLNSVSRPVALAKAKSLIKPENITTDDVFGFFKYLSIMTATFQTTDEIKANLSLLQDVLDLNNVSISQLYMDFAPTCTELVERCSWKNTIYRCDLLFRRILTSEGYCCSFNYFAIDQPAELAELNDLFLLTKPRRVASCGHLTALAFIMNTNPSNYYSSRFASYGARVFVDNAYNFPDKNSPLRLVNPKTELFIAVSPEVTYATKGTANLDPEVRKCRFEEEATLSTFKTYSYHNCLAECQAIRFQSLCGCVPYNVPHNDSGRECDFRDLACLEHGIHSVQRDSKLNVVNLTSVSGDRCDCVPDCEHINYPLEVTTGRLSRKGSLNEKAFFKSIELVDHSAVNVYFEDLVSIRYRRDVYLNFQNLVASFGGLLSLSLGFTLISAFDLIYFFSVRMIFDLFVKKEECKLIDRRRRPPHREHFNSKSTRPEKMPLGITSYAHGQDNIPIFRIKLNESDSMKLQVKEAKNRKNLFTGK